MNIQDPINVRDYYFGGRTNGLVLHKIFAEGEKGYYVDFTSLYPDILKYRRFSVGHPERITDNFQFCYVKHVMETVSMIIVKDFIGNYLFLVS